MGSIRKLPLTPALPIETLPFHEAPPLSPDGGVRGQQLARAMADAVMSFHPASDADALKVLRASFPDSPLGLRVAALALLNRRRSNNFGRARSVG